MARNDHNGKRPKIFWIIFLSILTIIMVVLLELGKHTVIGWILTAAAVAAYVIGSASSSYSGSSSRYPGLPTVPYRQPRTRKA